MSPSCTNNRIRNRHCRTKHHLSARESLSNMSKSRRLLSVQHDKLFAILKPSTVHWSQLLFPVIRILKKNRQMISVAFVVVDAIPSQSFHIMLSYLSAKAMHLPKVTVVAYVTDLPKAVFAPRSTLHNQPLVKPPI